MLLKSYSSEELKHQLRRQGVNVKIGPFAVNLSSSLPHVANNIYHLYGNYPTLQVDELVDFYIQLKAPSRLRRYFRPQASFSFDGYLPFKPLPQSQSFAMFEWGLNWCVANHAHQYLIIHAAVVEKNGRAFVFPGSPGSGKSTLCAWLVSKGWRLLSDEMALLSLEHGDLTPIPRPISLKNESIDIVKGFSDDIFVGEAIEDTAKGTVAHMRAPDDSVIRSAENAIPRVVIFPKYRQGAATDLSPLSKGRTFLSLAENSFNYHVLGTHAFDVLTGMIDQCQCFNFTYQNLDEAYSIMEELANA